MKLRTLALLAMLAAGPSAHAQAPVISGPAGPYRIAVKGPVSVVYQADGTAVITFGGATPVPPNPIDPPPPPDPTPPTPMPTPTWGPPAKAVVLYEADKVQPGEAWYDAAFLDAMDAVFGKERRYWDDDLTPPEDAAWAAAMSAAKAERPAGTDEPVLYAIDAQGRVQKIGLRSLSVENVVAAIKALGTN